MSTITLLVKSLIIPPASLFLMFLVGFSIRRKFPKASLLLRSGSLGLLFALSLPIVGHSLLSLLETHPVITDTDKESVRSAQAIVILSAGIRKGAAEFGGDDLSELSLERVRYGAFLAKRTQHPVCVCGGIIRAQTAPIANLMSRVLEQDFGVAVKWKETQSKTTWENAQFAASVLHSQGINRILLVTHSWHMPRSVETFEAFGFEVIPAPTASAGERGGSWRDFVPSARALQQSAYACHETIGRLWYRLKSP